MTASRGSVVTLPVAEYLDQLAAGTPVPGGGSAAAVAGAMGMALLAMVAQLSLKKATAAAAQRELRELAAQLDPLVEHLGRLGQDDVDAYRAVLLNRKEPADRPGRRTRQQASLLAAAQVPLETARLALQGHELAEHLGAHAWEGIGSDLATARAMLWAAFVGAMANVAINLPGLEGENRVLVEQAYTSLAARQPPPPAGH